VIEAGAAIERIPNTAQLSKGSEHGPLEFIEVMMEEVAAFDEV
jgi:hypothetical protein